MNTKILLIICFLISNAFCAQELFKPLYPTGLYKTKEDFITKKISSQKEIYADGFENYTWDSLKSVPDELFFRYKSTGRKVKNTFAISFNGYLFFQNLHIILPRNRNKKDRDQTTHDINAFSRVRQGGDNFFYVETELKSGWESGLYSNLGAAGSAALSKLNKLKGIVWDFKKNEFNIFRNCKDLNVFLDENYPEGKYECQSKKYNIIDVRTIIAKIK